jgi:putative salt-induced outer membrane protein YdiY
LAALVATTLVSLPSWGADAPPPPPPPKGWETVATAGVTLTRGNSQNFLASAGVNTVRKWSKDEALLGATAGYGNTKDQNTGDESTTQHYLKGFGQYNHLFTERFYGGMRVDGLYDKIAGVDYRFTISPLAGYYFIKRTNIFLSAEVGPSLVVEEVRGPRVNGEIRMDQNTYIAARVGQRFEYKFAGGAKLWETVEFLPQVDDFENWIANAEIGLSAPITKKLDVRVVFDDTYDHVPAPGREKNDLKLLAGLGYKF